MILAADIPWLDISISLLLILFVLNCLLLSLLILMQRPKQEGLGAAFGSGMTDQILGAQTASVLQKSTVFLGVMFFVLTLALAVLYSAKNSNQTTFKKEVEEQAEKSKTPEPKPEADEPTAPVTAEKPDEPSLEDQYGDVLGDTDASDSPPEDGENDAPEADATTDGAGESEPADSTDALPEEQEADGPAESAEDSETQKSTDKP